MSSPNRIAASLEGNEHTAVNLIIDPEECMPVYLAVVPII